MQLLKAEAPIFFIFPGSLTNSSELAICKRNIARVKTVIRQRELGLANAPEKEATKKSTKKTAKVDAEVKG